MVDERISRAIDNDHTAAIKVTSDGRKISRKKDGNLYATQGSYFVCAICKKVFKNHHLYRKHLKNHSDKSYVCQICSKGFVHKHYLHNHMSVHNIGKSSSFSCHICPKRFTHKNNLTQHLKFHASKKPFKCELCKKEFYQQEHLRAHVRHHNNERPFQCEVCDKSFNIKSSLQRHMNCHTGAKPFICDICHRGYTRRSVLMLHVQQVHENKKPYQCSECHTCFSQKGNLQAHFRRKHLQPKMDNKRGGNQRDKIRRTIRKQSFKQSTKTTKMSPLKNALFSKDIFTNSPKKPTRTSNMDFISLNGEMIRVECDTQSYDNPKLALQSVNGVADSQLSVQDHEFADIMSLACGEDTNNLLCKLNTAALESGALFRFLSSNDEVFCNQNQILPDLQDTDSMSSDQMMLSIPEDLKAMYEFDINSDPKDWEDYLLSDSEILNPYDGEILSSPTKNNPSVVVKTEPPEEDFSQDPIYLCHDYASPLPCLTKCPSISTDLRDIPSGCSRTSPMKKTIESSQVKKKQRNSLEKQTSEINGFKLICV